MRLAVTIIGIFLALIVGVQSCGVSFGGALTADESITAASGAGFVISLLFIIGSGFAIKIPKVSIVVFAIGALIGILVGANTEYKDLIVWGIVSLVLCILSFFGDRSLQRERY
jgi:hypothetical protein